MAVNLKQNLNIRQTLREGFLQYGRVLEVPDDMPDDVVAEVWKEPLAKGIIQKVQKFPTVKPPKEPAEPSPGKAPGKAPAPAREHPAPPSVQVFCSGGGMAGPLNNMSARRWGPCTITHVLIDHSGPDTDPLSEFNVGLHVSSTGGGGPFEGEMAIATFEDQSGTYLVGQGDSYIMRTLRMATDIGYRPTNQINLFPQLVVPFESFSINLSVGDFGAIQSVMVTVDFGPVAKASVSTVKIKTIEPRAQTGPRTLPRTVQPARPMMEQYFASYADVKAYEAQGHRIVWATTRNTNMPGLPLGIRVM